MWLHTFQRLAHSHECFALPCDVLIHGLPRPPPGALEVLPQEIRHLIHLWLAQCPSQVIQKNPDTPDKGYLLGRFPCHEPSSGSCKLRHESRSCSVSLVVDDALFPKACCFFIGHKRRGFAVPGRHTVLGATGCSLLLMVSTHVSQRCPSPLGHCPWIVAKAVF